ncbi:MAG: class II fructose-bisphosphate aldolase [Planctomycetes bacterium]|nr:class II fructose-bisphosphate aldolase [Planctomycetota bacterium]
MKRKSGELIQIAWKAGITVPAFNMPYLPMIEPVVRALRDSNTFGLIQVCRIDWLRFQSKSLRAVRDEYEKLKDERYTRLHLDHVPVIDEDHRPVDYESIITEAIELGYESVMVDASRLPLEENIAATAKVVRMAHSAGIVAEGELGAVFGHEAGPLPPYEELYATGKGFTDPGEAGRFVKETNVDWLSVAIGNVHGAISGAAMSQKKVSARLNIEHLDRLSQAASIPLVLHGGSGIGRQFQLEAFRHGMAKINICT